MEIRVRQDRLLRYGNAHAELVEGLKRFPREMWHYRAEPDQWSIHETVIHIADSEANSFVRCRRLIAEPGTEVMAYDENAWAAGLDYRSCSIETALELFRWLRQSSYELIRMAPEECWAHTIKHPENGIMTLDDWLDVYARHVTEHLAQMQATYDAWCRAQATAPAA